MTELLEGEAIPQRLDVDVVRAQDVATQLRAADPEDAPLGTLVGDFSVFGEWYEIDSLWEGHFLERIKPGAFKRTINNRSGQSPVRVLLEHGFDPTVGDKPLGVPRTLEERGTGVYAETPLLDTTYNRDLAPALEAGAYGQSFRFQVRADEWVEPDADGWEDPGNPAWSDLPQRTITEVRLQEFGPTVWPASPATNASTGLRSATDTYYEALARRDRPAFDAATRSVRGLRAPATSTPPAGEETQRTITEDPQDGHSETAAAPVERHVEDPPVRHSEDTSAHDNSQKEKDMSDKLTLEERAARIAEIDGRLTEIDHANAGDALRSDDQNEWDALTAERAEHARAIKAQERRQEYLSTVAANPDAQESDETRDGRDVQPRRTAPAAIIKPENIYDTAAIRSRANSVDQARGLYLDHARRAVEVAKFPGVADRAQAQERASDLLERLDNGESTLALRMLNTGSAIYERAFGKAVMASKTDGLSTEEQRALALGSDAAGGFAVPFQLDPTVILTSDGAINPLRDISRVVQITGKKWEGLTTAGVSVSRKGEAQEADDNSPTFAQPVVDTSRVEGFIPFSYELEYTWPQLRQELTMLLSDAKDMEEASSFVNGTGLTAGGAGGTLPQGVLTGATTNVLTASGTALTRADLDKLVAALPPRYRARAKFLGSVQFYSAYVELYNSLFNLRPVTSANGTRTIVDYSFYESSALPAYSPTLNTVAAIFGDFNQFVIVDRVGMNVELIPQVFGANQRPTGQRGIFAIWMNGSKVLVPNAFRVLKQAAA